MFNKTLNLLFFATVFTFVAYFSSFVFTSVVLVEWGVLVAYCTFGCFYDLSYNATNKGKDNEL